MAVLKDDQGNEMLIEIPEDVSLIDLLGKCETCDSILLLEHMELSEAGHNCIRCLKNTRNYIESIREGLFYLSSKGFLSDKTNLIDPFQTELDIILKSLNKKEVI